MDKIVDELAANFSDALLPPQFCYDNDSPPDAATVKGTSAVLIVLRHNRDQNGITNSEDWQILFTVRSRTLRRHPGEVCFPGGMREPVADATPVNTALREAEEEIGLTAASVRVVGTLRPIIDRLAVRIYPVLAVWQSQSAPAEPLRHSDEVDHFFWAPLQRFLSRRGHGFVNVEEDFRIHIFIMERPVFGVTAALAILIAIGVYGRMPDYDLMPRTTSGSAGDTPAAARRRLVEILADYGRIRPPFGPGCYEKFAAVLRQMRHRGDGVDSDATPSAREMAKI